MKNNIIDIQRVPLTPIEIVTLVEAKAQCVVTYSDDDTLISQYILRAIKAIENYCNISIQPYTITLLADLFVQWELPYGPVTGVSTVQVPTAATGSGPTQYTGATPQWNTAGEQFVMFIPTGAGRFDTSQPFTGYFQWGPWASPYGVAPGLNRWKIVYTTGYGTNTPDDLKQAILLQTAWLYEHRGEETVGMCDSALNLAMAFKRELWR